MTSQQNAHDLLGTITNDSNRFQQAQPGSIFTDFKFWTGLSLNAIAAIFQTLLRLAIIITIIACPWWDSTGYNTCWVLICIEIFLYRLASKSSVCSAKLWKVEDHLGNVSYFIDKSAMLYSSIPIGENLFWAVQIGFMIWLTVLSLIYLFGGCFSWVGQYLLSSS